MTQRRKSQPKRRIAVVTGTRAEFGTLAPTMHAIAAHPQLTLQTVATGMHLLRKFGSTIREIERAGFAIDARIPMQRGDDDPADQGRGLGRGVAAMAEYFVAAKTDIVVVLGDRIEALAGALAGVTTGCAVAQIHGGDVAEGDFDDSLRHSITKLAHIHLAASADAARRIIRLGEHPEYIYIVGAPGLEPLRALLDARQQPNAPAAPDRFSLVVYHAHGRSAGVEERVATMVYEAVAAAGLSRLILYPNSDRGHAGVLRALERHAAKYAKRGDVEVVKSLPRAAYLERLVDAAVMVGNSSSGVIEAPFAGTPSVNVGVRQAGRLPGGPSVIDAGESRAEIDAGLAAALRKRPQAGKPGVYGDGRVAAKTVEILANTKLGPELLRKRISY